MTRTAWLFPLVSAPAIAGPVKLSESIRMLIPGEMHGTRETPAGYQHVLTMARFTVSPLARGTR